MRLLRSKVLLLLLLSQIGTAQSAPGPATTVLVSITNKAGYPPEVELRDRVQVNVEKQLAKVISVEPASDLPVHIAVMIDRSGPPSALATQEEKGATAFLDRFVRPNVDRPFMSLVAQGLPNMSTIRNYADYRAALARKRNLSGDSVLDALKSYVGTVNKMYGPKFPARRAVILFSNGGTQIGQDFLPKIREYVITQHITMFVVNTDWTWRYFGTNSNGIMREMAEDTGGTFENASTGSGSVMSDDELADILNRMGAIIRNQYQLAFESTVADEKLHSLQVQTPDPTLVLHAPQYFIRTK
jgi:hypothetical protein